MTCTIVQLTGRNSSAPRQMVGLMLELSTHHEVFQFTEEQKQPLDWCRNQEPRTDESRHQLQVTSGTDAGTLILQCCARDILHQLQQTTHVQDRSSLRPTRS
ncbi:hypothetical protein CHARACLAT_013508 [Characodon lateralis]|uniref:Uncharacterized protein n=1 Tax=Characodon lateralis TaxID=208331 RepID=A0ABU7CR32_9TELE|nr:hypothetical protein [Characodon lateralis]